MKEPKVQVGILFEPQIKFILLTPYHINGEEVSGKQIVTYHNGHILWQGHSYDELLFEPLHEKSDAFELQDVTIGINFHWERKENQRFIGALKIIVENKKLTGINVIHVEDYLTSVISSEMSATASLELLKAHAVISRSWLLAGLSLPYSKDREKSNTTPEKVPYSTSSFSPLAQEAENKILIRWYERDAHTHFDVCADDHCQRYQGITRASTDMVRQAISATRGEVLMSEGTICDARFSKCCGGAFEEFQYCWENIRHPYLSKQRDSKKATDLPDLCKEAEAERWIRTSPEAFCNTKDKKVLSQVLNNYDQETTDFYRWKVEYEQEELSKLILKRSGIDYGQILDLVPVERGTSGRLVRLKIIGTKRTMIIGKELEIRRTLSPSHLYSSAFIIDKVNITNGIPDRFILTGAGWGHGVGLCQIGAAVMGEQGYTYDTILLHYYIGATILNTHHYHEKQKYITVGMDSDSLLCTRITLCSRNDYLGNYVQKSGYLQHRYRSLYLLALFTMGYQTFLESICRFIKNQTLVDSQHAAIGRCRTGRNRFHHTYVKLLPNDPCHFLASGIQLGYT